MLLKFYLGVFALFISFIAISLNITIFLPVFRLAFIAKKSSVYIIAFFNIISDLFQLSTVFFYLAPSIIADRYVLTEERDNSASVFLGGYFLNAWYMECLIQVVMAVNRFTIITLRNYHVFTFRKTCIIFVFLISLTLLTAYADQYLFPCCVFISDHEVLSIRFILVDGVYNYSNLLLVSYDFFCTVSSTLCYIFVFFTIRSANVAVASSLSQDKRKQDVKYLLQFVFISIFYICTWVLFEILPHIVPDGEVEWFVVVPILITCNCSSNAVIYMFLNQEVQKALPIPWLRNYFIKANGPAIILVAPATLKTSSTYR